MDQIGKLNQVSKNEELSVKRQCELLEVNRSSVYYTPKEISAEKKEREELIKARLDFWHTYQCYLGVRGLKTKLRKEDNLLVGRKLISRYMDEIGIYAVYPKPNLSKANKQHKKYLYLLRNKAIIFSNQVWGIDITYIKMGKTHMYLTAIIDWYSRFIVGWQLSDTLDTVPVLEAVKSAIATYGVPSIINSDQGSQFTSNDYTSFLSEGGIRQSMDGRARWVDNVIIIAPSFKHFYFLNIVMFKHFYFLNIVMFSYRSNKRWFRSLKCENIYITEYNSPRELRNGIAAYIQQYNNELPHSSHNNKYPSEVHGVHFVA